MSNAKFGYMKKLNGKLEFNSLRVKPIVLWDWEIGLGRTVVCVCITECEDNMPTNDKQDGE